MLPHQVIVIAVLAAFCALSLAVKENYPFSHYPMYSDPDPVAHYYHLADAEGRALPIYELTSVTSPNLGKIYRQRSQARAKELGVSVTALPAAAREEIGRELAAYLREQARFLKMESRLPAVLRIMRTAISFENDQLVERPEVLYAGP